MATPRTLPPYSASLNPLAGVRSHTSKGRGGKGREEGKRKGTRGTAPSQIPGSAPAKPAASEQLTQTHFILTAVIECFIYVECKISFLLIFYPIIQLRKLRGTQAAVGEQRSRELKPDTEIKMKFNGFINTLIRGLTTKENV